MVIVDWRQGATIPYLQATANTQLVGRLIALVVNHTIAEVGAAASDFHLVGHSLGAHICGYAGNGIDGLGRITGGCGVGTHHGHLGNVASGFLYQKIAVPGVIAAESKIRRYLFCRNI